MSQYKKHTKTKLLLALLTTLPVLASAANTKEQQFEAMEAIQAELATLKSNHNNNPETAQQFQLLQLELDNISNSLGGDLPCATGDTTFGSSKLRQAATAPPGCVPTTTNFANNNTTAIPAGPAVVSSTINVTGLDTYLWDLDVRTFIEHTFPGDLDITITSPAGTVVTLTTDNGGTNDNVYNGTVWDDTANPAGQVPYTSNNGLVTDHSYANLTLASPLVPEESLAAFVGEDPNGIWTLTISDDAGGDAGNLTSWDLNLTTFPTPVITMPVQTFTQATPTAVPAGPSVVASTLNVSGTSLPLCKLELLTDLTHTFPADLDITLTSPTGTVVTLTTDNGTGQDNVFSGTLWDDFANPAGTVPYTTNNGIATDHAYVNLTTATPLVAEESLGAFLGQMANGDWTITISDDLAGDGGQLSSWELRLTTCECSQADLSVAILDTPDPVAAGSMLTYTVTATNNGPTSADDVAIQLPLAAGTSFVSADGGAGSVCNATSPVMCSWAGATANGNNRVATIVVAVDPLQTTMLDTSATVSTTTVDPVPGNNTAMVSTTVVPSADLSVTITDTPDPVVAGELLTYTVTATNNGPGTANDVAIQLPLPAGTNLASADGGTGGICNATSPVMCNWPGATANGSSRIANIMVAVDPAQSATLNAAVTASTTTNDPAPANNTAMTSTAVTATADLTISKTASGVPTPLIIGSAFSYILDVSNAGPSAANNVMVTDTLPASLNYVSNDCGASFAGSTVTWNIASMAPGSNLSCTLNVTVASFGTIENTASIIADIADPNGANNSSSAVITGAAALPVPALAPYGLVLLILLSMGVGVLAIRRL